MSTMSMTQSSPLSAVPPGGPQQKFFASGPRFQSSFHKSNHHHHHHHHHGHHQVLNATQFRPLAPSGGTQQGGEFDGKRLRKAVTRRTIDYNAAVIKQLETRVWQRDRRDHRAIQPDYLYYPEMVPPTFFVHNPINSVTTRFVRTSTNKMRCPIFCVAWTPEGRRLVTGASSGEFTLWNGLTFNFETILQAHDSPVRCMVWSHTDQWMVTGDHAGFVKYWQSNMNNVKMFQAHKEPLRGISFCPTDTKFATCSDDGTVRIWDFLRCHEEKILRGHGADVKCVAWHPQKALLVSGSKDSQQPIKLWDPKSGQSLATLHAHKSTVMEAKWNENGNWLLTGSRDHLIKLFDIRKLSQEVQTFRGHKKEVSSLAWHPMHESLFASGGSDGAVMFWLTGVDKEVGCMEQAHDSIVWSLDWHPLGHILCSGSNDHTCKFWTRNRPGDKMRDKYNLNMMPIGGSMDDFSEYDDALSAPSIPGMGLDQSNHAKSLDQLEEETLSAAIPGLDFGSEEPQMPVDNKANVPKKIPYSKPIPRQFQQQWMDANSLNSSSGQDGSNVNDISVPHPPVGDSQNSLSSVNPAMIPLPPQHVVQNLPPPLVQNRMMGPGGDLSQGPHPPGGMPMMWPSRPPFPPIRNGNPFSLPPPQVVPRSSPQETSKNWKEFGDSDFRVPMDSDLRLLGTNKSGPGSQDTGSDITGEFDKSIRNVGSSELTDEKDQDMRHQMHDTDARIPLEFQNATAGSGSGMNVSQNNPSSNDNYLVGTGDTNRRGRWGPFVNSRQPVYGKGDLDERLLPVNNQESNVGDGETQSPHFNQPMPQGNKRGWDVGPGMSDFNNQSSRDGPNNSGPPPPPHMQRDDQQSFRMGDGMQRFRPPPLALSGRGMPPWGAPQMRFGMRGPGGPGSWFRGGPFRGGPPRGRMGMRGPFPP